MNRKILFRGKCVPESKYAGEWVFGGCVQCENGETLIISAQSDNCTSTYHVIPDSVGQFIGMCDKNGKEIFEGDIVKNDISRGNATKNKTYRNFAIRYSAPEFWNGYDPFTMSSYRMEVIGNVHDNPELLKQ